ncbi:MAG: VCBS repeat-containing protein [Gammaproteobacteria bacterium]|nr:VCBS repeat-containing protein [Gammaproteobacteria bacterium]MCP5140311.1 VCBS repeat-containing protein [Chromatiales bacterium]
MLSLQAARTLLRSVSLTGSAAALVLLSAMPANAANYCPAVWKKGVLPLNFNPAFTHIDKFNVSGGGQQDDLLVSSFYNVTKDPTGTIVTSYFSRDLVARIPGLDTLDVNAFDKDSDVEVLTDLGGPPYKTVWPNHISRVPDGVVPFEAVVSPQGFLAAEPPGRLSLINMDDPNRQEYIVHQSTAIADQPCDGTAANKPRFYHDVQYADMDADGYQDIVTVRSAFKPLGPGSFCAFFGDLVYFKNPGPAINPNTEWEEHLLFGYPSAFTGPDLSIRMYDFENDGVPEVVASHFFNRNGAIRIYGAPVGMNWSSVDPVNGPFVRQANVAGPTSQGQPFGFEIVDLNLDGKVDILFTNHQRDNCFDVTQSVVPGRVVALEQPVSGNVFAGSAAWPMHILKDDIRPNPTFPAPDAAPGRLAPGLAVPFTPIAGQQGKVKPWIVVGGDEASKVWLLTPKVATSKTNWEYLSAVIFDINDAYGPGTTQTLMGPSGISPGEVISTIGTPSVRYDGAGATARTEIYIPVFEAKAIHVLSLRPGSTADRVACPPDVREACPVAP